MRESKKPVVAFGQIVDAINMMLDYDKAIEILIEPIDQAYIPTVGHAIALSHKAIDPSRIGVLVESAYCILAGLDPSD
jgi:xylose isomerase